MDGQPVRSQIFDVRPRDTKGNLGVEPDKALQADLAFQKRKKSDDSAGRVINLVDKRPGDFLLGQVRPVRKKRGRKPKVVFETAKISEPAEEQKALFGKFPQSRPTISEPLEISHPEREEILAALAEIEELHDYLKNSSWSAESASEILVEAPEIGPGQVDEVDFIDLEEYLGLAEVKSEIPPAIVNEAIYISEADYLETFLAEPVSVVEAAVEVALVVEPKISLFGRLRAFLARYFSFRQPRLESLIPVSRKTWQPKERSQIKALVWRGTGFISAGFLIYLVIFGLSLAGQGLIAKENILSSALQAYQAMLAAKQSATNLNFSAASVDFETAYQNFLAAEQELNKMGRGVVYVLDKLPGGSVVGSGAALVKAGEKLAEAGRNFSQVAELFLINDLGGYFSDNGPSLTQKIVEVQSALEKARLALAAAADSLAKVNVNDLPAEVAPAVSSLKEKIPTVLAATGQLKDWSNVFLQVLGHQRAKKYLLIFQNNSEARPTGGFIGTYGLVDLDEGRIKNLFVDGIFNLDGQLYEKIVPPQPVQKISTAWSTHDANWFADFPASARKIMSFYEKAGGQTVDGVISLTPTVIERLLSITGPIAMPAYGVTLAADNFLDVTQYKVEVDYDKQLNQPKKILADFAPLFLDRLWQIWPQQGQAIFKALVDSLAEKQILFYFSDPALEKTFVDQGWAGEILATEKDYLSVVNTNLNGFKTDKVVEQKVYHQAQLQADGAVIDTVRIVRRHLGGQSQYGWYNKVNADYLRVYVPLGSRLISAQGQTLEGYSAPIDYQAQGFKTDPDVAAQERGMMVDAKSGTQIFEESGKTVFGNWVYVSPGETVEVTYQYALPFKINLGLDSASYSLLAQKQSGSLGSAIESVLQLPSSLPIAWQYPTNLVRSGQQIKFSADLKTDKFYGIVFGR